MSARLELTASVGEVVEATRDLEEYARRHGLPPDRARVLRLVAEEILANIVEHSRGPATGEPIVVQVDDGPGELRLVIVDAADPFDPTVRPDPVGPACRASGGVGLALVHRLVDGLSYDRVEGRNRTTAVFAKGAPAGARAAGP